jgi:peroxiredoxin
MRIFLLAALLLTILGAPSVPAETDLPRETDQDLTEGYVGRPVVPFQSGTVTGGTVSSGDFRGRVLLLDLWGLNCVSCLEELKALEEIYGELHDRGLEVWGLNTEKATAREIVEGLASRGIQVSFPLLTDPDLEVTRQFTKWFIPVTVIVDEEGIIQYYKVGFKERDIKVIRGKVGVLLGE